MAENGNVGPPPPAKGFLGDLISSVFAYIDRPWKAVVVVVLILVGGFGWVAYQNQQAIIEAYLTPTQPELKTADVPDALTKLTTETGADLVQIWAIDLSKNSQWFLGARRHDGERPVIPPPRLLPVIVHASDLQSLINVMEGRPTCVDLSVSGSPLARRLAERGMKRGCAIPIPPTPESFVGVIYLAWATAVDDSAEKVAIGAAREVASSLATH